MSDRRAVVGLFVTSLTLRILVVAAVPSYLWFAGGDGPWYARQAWFLAHASLPEPLRTVGPIYPLALSAVWMAFPNQRDPIDALSVAVGFLTCVRLMQALLGAFTVAFVYVLTRRLAVSRRAAWLAAFAVAIGPAFVIEPILLHTETLCIALLVATVLLHVRNSSVTPGASGLAGSVAALAALTRPVLLLFPFVLAFQLVLVHRSTQAGRAAAALLIGATLTLAPWHIWLHRTTGSWLPAGFASNLWISTQRDGGPLEVMTFHELEGRLERTGRGYLGGAYDQIASDPVAWIARRARNLTSAIVQPHGTSDLGGPSTKEALVAWWRGDRSLRGFLRFTSSWTFWLRAVVYAFHYAALILAVWGAKVTSSGWREWSPVYAAVLYILLVHALLPANPRYLFPVEPFLWVLGGAAMARMTFVTREAHPR